jgi:hypothetical protein
MVWYLLHFPRKSFWKVRILTYFTLALLSLDASLYLNEITIHNYLILYVFSLCNAVVKC